MFANRVHAEFTVARLLAPFLRATAHDAGMAEHVVLRLQRRPGGLCAEVMRLVNVRLRSFGFIEG